MGNTEHFDIRKAEMKDAAIIARYNVEMAQETEGRTLDDNTLLSGVQNGIARPERCQYFVAEKSGTVIGQAMITYEWSDWRDGELWWLQSVYVHPEHRRQGVFKNLFAHIDALARKENHVRGLRLYVEADNHQGQSVYSRIGMFRTGYQVFEKEYNSI